MRILLDTNVLLSCISRKNKLRSIWDAFLDDKFQLVISLDIFYEYIEILEQQANINIAENISEILRTSDSVLLRREWFRWKMIRADPDDDKFFDIAIAANADYLITDDAHFNIAKGNPFPALKIITPEEFLEIIKF